MRLCSLIFLLFVLLQNAVAQINDTYLTRYNEVYTLDKAIEKDDKVFYLLDGQWMPGMISIIGGKENLLQEIRYNLQADQLEIKLNGKVYTLDHKYVDKFYISSGVNRYNFNQLNLGLFDLDKTNYVQVLSDGNDFDLFKYYRVIKSKLSFNPVLQTGPKKSKTTLEVFYGFSDMRTFKELPNSGRKRNKFLKKIPQFKKSIVDSDLDLSKEKDLINLFTIVNNKITTNENIK